VPVKRVLKKDKVGYELKSPLLNHPGKEEIEGQRRPGK
jgi:hypothetical protein